MPLEVGLPVAALVVVAAAAPVLTVAWRHRRGAPEGGRIAARLLISGLAVTVGWFAIAGLLALTGTGGTHAYALTGSIGVPLATALLIAGIERTPGIVDTPETRLRWRLDVLSMAPALFLSGWLLVVIFGNHAEQFHLHPTWFVLGTAFPVVAVTMALAVGIVLFLRSATSQFAIGATMAGVLAVVLGGAVTVIGILADVMSKVMAGGIVTAAGLILLSVCTSRFRHLLEPEPIEVRTGWMMSAVTISFALVMIIAEVWLTGSFDSVGAFAGVLTGFALVGRQGRAIADAKKLSQQLRIDEVHLRQMAFTDALTGVGNRRELLRVLHDEVVDGPECVLLAIDLDGFKNINDLRGHDVGDAVLVEVAQRLRANLRPGDLAARMGGDEYAVLMWARLDQAHSAALRLLVTLGQPYQTDTGSVFVSASIGLAGSDSAPDIAGLLRNADLALRFAKLKGKDRVELYDATFDGWFRKRTEIEHELRGAIARDELSLAFQPVVSLPDAVPVGVEALLRWNHPKLGAVPPDEFIPIAEESGLIAQLDHWVLHRACRQLGHWLAAGHDLWMSVNISPRELHLVDYVTRVLDTVNAHGVPPERLVLEITEHVVAVDQAELVGRLTELREAGIRIALDDFGAGYSSLGQLRTLPVDILKIDRSLVGDPMRSEISREARPLVDVVVRLGRRLGLKVIAEGVSEPKERTVVEAAGCRLGQGDLFGRAMPADRVDALLAEGSPGIPRPREAPAPAAQPAP